MNDSILYVIGSLDVGGAERHLVNIVPNFDRTRYCATIYTFTHPGALAPQVAARGIRIVSPPFRSLWKSGLLLRAIFLMLSFLRLIFLLICLRPAIVHAFLPMSFIFACVAGLITLRPYIIMSRRSLNDYQIQHPVARWLEHFLFRFASVGLGNSQAVVDQLHEEGFPPHRLGLVYNGIDVEAFDARSSPRESVRREQRCDLSAFVIVTLANLIAYKGHDDLLRALASIQNDLPDGWRLWCIGRDDGIGEELAALADRLAIAENVVWLGARDDVPALLGAADLFVHASHQEGFSNAVLEAMAAGLGALVTDVGGNAEAVVDGATGLIVPPHAPDALAAGLLRLYQDPALRRAFGEAARLRVKTRFSLDSCVSAYCRLYDGLRARSAMPVSAIIEGKA